MIRNLFIRDKKWAIILVMLAILIPVAVFGFASFSQKDIEEKTTLPTKPPLPTFPDVPRVEGELTIQYYEGQEFNNLDKDRQNEIMNILMESGVVSQEKSFESEEGPLAGYYLLRFKEGIDIEQAAEKIYEIPEIIGIEPNNQVELF